MIEISKNHIFAVHAIHNNDIVAFREAIRGMSREALDVPLESTGANLLLISARERRHLHIDTLLNLESDPNFQDFSGRTPILLSGFGADLQSMLFLYQAGSNIHHTDKFNNGLGHYVLRSNDPAAIDFVIGLGGMFNEGNDLGRTPLHIGAEDLKVVGSKHIMATRVGDPNKPDVFDETPIFSLMRSKHPNIRFLRHAIAVFIEGGASLDVKNMGRQSPIHVAEIEGRKAVSRLVADLAKLEHGIEDEIHTVEQRVINTVKSAVNEIRDQISSITGILK